MNYREVVRLHSVWRNMKIRCEDPTNKQFEDYGGRGIFIDPRWQDFNVFCEWALANGSSPELQLDRQDNDGPYSPENCRFITPSENARNTRRNHWITAFGETKLLIEWASDPRATTSAENIRRRIKSGWTPEEAITVPRASQRQGGERDCGHPRTDDNSYFRANGTRMCKICTKQRAKDRYWEAKNAA